MALLASNSKPNVLLCVLGVNKYVYLERSVVNDHFPIVNDAVVQTAPIFFDREGIPGKLFSFIEEIPKSNR
jgi:hypothetical protein